MAESTLESQNIADRTLREHPEIKARSEKLSEEKVAEFSERLAELSVEKAELGHLLYKETGKPRSEQKPDSQTRTISLEDELTAIKRGEIDRITTFGPEEPNPRLRKRLSQIEEEVANLVSYPQVVESHRAGFAEKIELLRCVREVEKLRQFQSKINEQDETLLVKRQETGKLSRPDEELFEANEARLQAIGQRIGILEKDPQVVIELRRRELLTFRRQLLKDGFVETPTVKSLLDTLMARVHLGEPILLWGDTGTGKTETVLHLAKKLTGAEPEIFSGSEEVTHYDLFGKLQLGPEGSYFQAGPAVRAIRSGRPLLIDEVDLVPHAIIGRIQHLLTRRPGDVITIQENSDEELKVPKGFIILATGNIRSAKYRREEMDPAFLRRFWQKGSQISSSFGNTSDFNGKFGRSPR